MAKYTTKQRMLLLAFFSEHRDSAFTAHQIADILKADKISLSAVYRNLSEMEAEGRVSKRSVSGSRDIFYQFIDVSCCRNSLHLSCEKCGKSYHLNELCMKKLSDALQFTDGFTLDRKQSVLLGICSACKQRM